MAGSEVEVNGPRAVRNIAALVHHFGTHAEAYGGASAVVIATGKSDETNSLIATAVQVRAAAAGRRPWAG